MRKFFLLICALLITSYLYGCSENDTAMPSNAATYNDNNEVNTDDISIIPEQTADMDSDSNNSMYAETNKTEIVSEQDGDTTSLNKEAIVVEAIEPHPMDGTGYASCDITFRNVSGQSLKIISLDVAFLDENGDIKSSTYPQYPSTVEDGQSCAIDVLYQEVPYSLQIASVSYYDMKDNYMKVFFETPYVFDIND